MVLNEKKKKKTGLYRELFRFAKTALKNNRKIFCTSEDDIDNLDDQDDGDDDDNVDWDDDDDVNWYDMMMLIEMIW